MASIRVFGPWELPLGGQIKIIALHGQLTSGCLMQNSDPPSCHQAHFYVSAMHERAISKKMTTDFGPTDYAIFKSPNAADWRLPNKEKLKILSTDSFIVRLCDYEEAPPGGHHGSVSDYTLRISRHPIGNRHYTFAIEAEKKNTRSEDANNNGCPYFIPPPVIDFKK